MNCKQKVALFGLWKFSGYLLRSFSFYSITNLPSFCFRVFLFFNSRYLIFAAWPTTESWLMNEKHNLIDSYIVKLTTNTGWEEPLYRGFV